jgi:hypothetical protein
MKNKHGIEIDPNEFDFNGYEDSLIVKGKVFGDPESPESIMVFKIRRFTMDRHRESLNEFHTRSQHVFSNQEWQREYDAMRPSPDGQVFKTQQTVSILPLDSIWWLVTVHNIMHYDV